MPTKKNPVKPKFFQPKETWTHNFLSMISMISMISPPTSHTIIHIALSGVRERRFDLVCQSGLSLSSSVPTKKNPVKPKFFQPKETWTHNFFCLASKEQVRAPSRAEKFDLQQAGLGRKEICFHSKAKFPELCKKLEEEYPKLSQGGGFELMRTDHQGSNTTLTTIIPPASGYSVPFLRDSSGLG